MMAATVAKVLRVQGCEGFESDISLGFGVRITRPVRLRRREVWYAYDGRGADAHHCLVVLIGGKDVLLSSISEDGRFVLADVYVTAPHAALDQVAIPGVPGVYVDVAEAMMRAEARGWDARYLREVLR